LRAAWREFADGIKGTNASICYAMKANSNLAVVKLFGDLGPRRHRLGGRDAPCAGGGHHAARIVYRASARAPS
jgi:diaminopimelate decarboxylase